MLTTAGAMISYDITVLPITLNDDIIKHAQYNMDVLFLPTRNTMYRSFAIFLLFRVVIV